MSTFTNNNVSSGDVVRASDHNTQGANIAAVVNGDIDNANISATAAISTTKLASDGFLGSWQSWTPAYATAGALTVGNGTVVARHVQIGKTVHAEYKLTFGSSTAIGSGSFELPVPMSTTYADNVSYIGTGNGYDTSANEGYPFFWRVNSVTDSAIRPIAIDSSSTSAQTTGISSSVPFTWTTGDVLQMSVTYEAA